MEGARRLLLFLVLATSGCHGSGDAPYGSFAPAPTPYVPRSIGGNAFDAYVLAAGETQAAIATLGYDPLRRTFFTPAQRKTLLKALAPALRRVAAARGTCDFHYVPVRPGETQPGRAAWRLLGRALRWRVDDDLVDSAANAVANAAVAFRFANDLCGGGPADRTLGVEIAEDAREAILPALDRLDPAGLHRLADAVKTGLNRRPPLEGTLTNGDADADLAIQTLQDAYRADDYAEMKGVLGRDFRDLESIRDLKGAKRAAFFDGLETTRRELSKAWHAAATLPASRRADVLDVKLRGDKARRAFARHFFLIGKPLLVIEDRSVARLRLLVLEAELRRVVRVAHRAPLSLDRVSPPWAIDPYSGSAFGYLPDGTEFRVYSIGENLRDDLGDTDAAGLEPDIRTISP